VKLQFIIPTKYDEQIQSDLWEIQKGKNLEDNPLILMH